MVEAPPHKEDLTASTQGKSSPGSQGALKEETEPTSWAVKKTKVAANSGNKKPLSSKGKLAANTPRELSMCMCGLPETVVKHSGVDATNPMLWGSLTQKGESPCDIPSIAMVTGADVTATCQKQEGLLRPVDCRADLTTTNVGDGVYEYLMQGSSDTPITKEAKGYTDGPKAATAGDTDYGCAVCLNTHGSKITGVDAYSAGLWMSSQLEPEVTGAKAYHDPKEVTQDVDATNASCTQKECQGTGPPFSVGEHNLSPGTN